MPTMGNYIINSAHTERKTMDTRTRFHVRSYNTRCSVNLVGCEYETKEL